MAEPVASFSGLVCRGRARGRQLGFPTANLQIDSPGSPPLQGGVYAARARWGQAAARLAVVNIGVRPTFGEAERMVEVHVLDFEGDLYGKRLDVELVERLRDERTFSSREELVDQIGRDIERARQALNAL